MSSRSNIGFEPYSHSASESRFTSSTSSVDEHGLIDEPPSNQKTSRVFSQAQPQNKPTQAQVRPQHPPTEEEVAAAIKKYHNDVSNAENEDAIAPGLFKCAIAFCAFILIGALALLAWMISTVVTGGTDP